jgi:hypothetical protein
MAEWSKALDCKSNGHCPTQVRILLGAQKQRSGVREHSATFVLYMPAGFERRSPTQRDESGSSALSIFELVGQRKYLVMGDRILPGAQKYLTTQLQDV